MDPGTAPLISLNWTSLMILANLIILYIILKRFFFEKIHDFMVKRQDAVKDAFDQAEATNRRADEKLENYNKRISSVEDEGRDIIREAKTKAEANAKAIVDEATAKANQMVVAAEKQIERDQAKAMADMREQIATLAMLAAEKIVEKDIQATGQDQIVNEIIEEAGKSKWQS